MGDPNMNAGLSGQTRLFLRPRRTRCSGCGITHVLLAEELWPRRADAAVVIGAGLEIAALGMGHRRIAAHLGLAEGTVRGWLRPGGFIHENGQQMFTTSGGTAVRRCSIGTGTCHSARGGRCACAA